MTWYHVGNAAVTAVNGSLSVTLAAAEVLLARRPDRVRAQNGCLEVDVPAGIHVVDFISEVLQ